MGDARTGDGGEGEDTGEPWPMGPVEVGAVAVADVAGDADGDVDDKLPTG